MENEKLKEELTIAHLKDMLADKNVKKEYLTLPFNNSTLLRMMQTRMEEDKLKNQENKINLEKEKVDAQLKLNEVNKKLDENKEENKEEMIDTSTNKKNISDLGTEMYNMAAKINKSSGYKDYFNLFKDVIVNENLNYEEIVSKYESIYGSKRGGEKNDPNTVIAFLLERIREVRPKEEGQQDQ